MNLRIITYGVIAWGVSKSIELVLASTIGTDLSVYLAQLLYTAFDIIVFLIAARLMAKYILSYYPSYWKILSWQAGLIWVILYSVGDVILWIVVYGVSVGEFFEPYMIWKGNLKLIRVFIHFSAVNITAKKLMRKYK